MIHAYVTGESPRMISITFRAHYHNSEMKTDGARHFETLNGLRRAVKSYRNRYPWGKCRVQLRFADGRLFRAIVISSMVAWLETKFGSVEVIVDAGKIEALPARPELVG